MTTSTDGEPTNSNSKLTVKAVFLSESTSDPDLLLSEVLYELEKRLDPEVDMSKVYIYLVIRGHWSENRTITSSRYRLDTLDDVEWILTDIGRKALEYYRYHQRSRRDMCILNIVEPHSKKAINEYIRKLTKSTN